MKDECPFCETLKPQNRYLLNIMIDGKPMIWSVSQSRYDEIIEHLNNPKRRWWQRLYDWAKAFVK